MAHQWIICGGIGQGVGKSARDDTVPQAAVLVPMPAGKERSWEHLLIGDGDFGCGT